MVESELTVGYSGAHAWGEPLSPDARAIAFYLPQFHPIPENNDWWGEGFTEWTNVRQATPLFADHYQPRVPSELGYYDLRSSETREAQADLARAHGIEGFCYWHYWFAGHRLLERPFNAVVGSGRPDFPFCLAWANHSWTASWVGRPWELLIEQTYPGRADYEAHFHTLRDAFADDRYIKVDGKPLFLVFRPDKLADPQEFTDCWRELAQQAGFKGLYLLGIMNAGADPGALGLDGGVHKGLGHLLSFLPSAIQRKAETRRRSQVLLERPGLAAVHQAIARSTRPAWLGPLGAVHDELSERVLLPSVCSYRELVESAARGLRVADDEYPCVLPNWDNTPRVGRWGWVLQDSSPELFAEHLRHALSLVSDRPLDKRLVFLKSWNEWAEGNYLEPDERFGRAYLEATRDALCTPVHKQVREIGT
ncbi:MAG: glycoside hydrolase family 99-like domain-containing protein [Polyangiales bacterium]